MTNAATDIVYENAFGTDDSELSELLRYQDDFNIMDNLFTLIDFLI